MTDIVSHVEQRRRRRALRALRDRAAGQVDLGGRPADRGLIAASRRRMQHALAER